MRRNSFNRKLRRALAASLGAFAFASSASIINAVEDDHAIRARIRFLNWLYFGPNGNVNNNNNMDPTWINTGKNQASQALKEFLDKGFTWAGENMTLTGRNLNNEDEITSNIYNVNVNALNLALGQEADMGNNMKIRRAGIYLKPANNGQNNKVKMDILLIKRHIGFFGNGGNYRVAVNQLAVTAQPQNGHLNWPHAIAHQGFGVVVNDEDVNKAVLNWTRGTDVRNSYLQQHNGYDQITGDKKPHQHQQAQNQNQNNVNQNQNQNLNNANNNVQHQQVNNVQQNVPVVPPPPPPDVPPAQRQVNAHPLHKDLEQELKELADEMAKKNRQKEYQEKMQQEEDDFLNIGILDDEELVARNAKDDEKKRKKEEGKRQYLEEKRRKVEEEARKLVTAASYSPPAAPAYSPATSAAIASLAAMTPLVSNIAPIANHTPMTIQTPVNQVNAGIPTVATSNITTPVGPQAGTTNVGTQNVTAQGTATQQTQTNSNVNHGNVVTKGDSSKNSVSSVEKLTR